MMTGSTGSHLSTGGAQRPSGRLFAVAIAGSLALVLGACQSSLNSTLGPGEYSYPDKSDFNRGTRGNQGTISEGLALIGGEDEDTGAKIGVNALLWRASLDTVSFMPLASADPFGGVIITDWYSDPATPNERFKVSVYILDKRLRADALRVSLFRQTKRGGRWADAASTPEAARQLEDQILTRARQLRIARTEG